MKQHYHFRRHGLGIFLNKPIDSGFSHLTPANLMGMGAPRKKLGFGSNEPKVKPISFYF
jgi:hypothetical protein